ncbi:cardiolipin synthase [Microbacterium fluvii]|uniref:Cardiolipin synthase n=1 Tax=Microbacterium fluvii TaxID=415215 RepID=A0ABW2HFC1_9MICO|nr:cardiolipin synthase [Microbacterium fluvii]MCU4672301.1 cardiolipin synthase [Microbacterium fluvii]
MNGALGANLGWLIGLAVQAAIIAVALIVIPRRRKPTAAMAWILLIVIVPLVGWVFYLLIGSFRLPAKRRDEQRSIDQLIAARAGEQVTPVEGDWSASFATVLAQNTALTHLPPVDGNGARLYADYRQSIDAMAADIDRAASWVHVEFYIVSCDTTTQGFFDAMERAVARGVTVRLLADYVATRRLGNWKETTALLDRIGVQWAWMLPVRPLRGEYQRPDLRNHRKIVVVDGTVGYLGSQNLISRDYNSPKNQKRGLMWQELVSRIEGPAVAAINAVFLSDWKVETGELASAETLAAGDVARSDENLLCQVVPSGPAYDTENNLRLFLSLIHGATERVIITSPYFVPDEAMVYAITTACQRGLEVQLFVSEIGDQFMVWHAQRSYYEVLLEAGVRIFLYPAPYILHSKHFSIDDDIAVIGSSNMDIRSFSLNAEVMMLVRGAGFVAQMREVEEDYRQAGRELTLAQWREEPRSSTFLDGVMRLTSALN